MSAAGSAGSPSGPPRVTIGQSAGHAGVGVASGAPHPNEFVIWTRLVPELFSPDGGMPSRRVPVEWKVALDEGMRLVVTSGTVSAVPELAHSVPCHGWRYDSRHAEQG